jgi:hypothetical protein
MIRFGEGWFAQSEQIFHACGPDVRTVLEAGQSVCACGASVPSRVEQFRTWLVESDPTSRR